MGQRIPPQSHETQCWGELPAHHLLAWEPRDSQSDVDHLNMAVGSLLELKGETVLLKILYTLDMGRGDTTAD